MKRAFGPTSSPGASATASANTAKHSGRDHQATIKGAIHLGLVRFVIPDGIPVHGIEIHGCVLGSLRDQLKFLPP
jgi:hypothetical protein